MENESQIKQLESNRSLLNGIEMKNGQTLTLLSTTFEGSRKNMQTVAQIYADEIKLMEVRRNLTDLSRNGGELFV